MRLETNIEAFWKGMSVDFFCSKCETEFVCCVVQNEWLFRTMVLHCLNVCSVHYFWRVLGSLHNDLASGQST